MEELPCHWQTIQRCTQIRGHGQVHTLTLTREVFHKMFLIFLRGKGVRLKCLPDHTNGPGISFPFNIKLLLTFKIFIGSHNIWGRKTDEQAGPSQAPSDDLCGRWGGHDFYFSNQTHTMTTHFPDRVYSAESHILNMGSFGEGKQLPVQPCLCSK